nr:MAG TPA: hypothetical protein [Caudoviricetes sp.]
MREFNVPSFSQNLIFRQIYAIMVLDKNGSEAIGV